jgi:pSer/pThr/pTyr-binding forkhead associated (FHA) protein
VPSYLADFEAEYLRLGLQAFVRAYPWPVLVVSGIAGALGDNTSKSGTMIATSASAMMQATALEGRVFPVVKGRHSGPGPVSIGRTSDNDLAIPEYTISTHHCLLALVDGEYRITDMGATNGTHVNEVLLVPRKPCRLKGGEIVRMGRFSLLFHLASGFAEYLSQRPSAREPSQSGPASK